MSPTIIHRKSFRVADRTRGSRLAARARAQARSDRDRVHSAEAEAREGRARIIRLSGLVAQLSIENEELRCGLTELTGCERDW